MNWLERHFGEHICFGRTRESQRPRVTIYGFNAMHVAIDIWTERWGYLCFHPPMWCFSKWWPWYFYVSRDATPCRPQCTYRIGPGLKEL